MIEHFTTFGAEDLLRRVVTLIGLIIPTGHLLSSLSSKYDLFDHNFEVGLDEQLQPDGPSPSANITFAVGPSVTFVVIAVLTCRYYVVDAVPRRQL